MRCVSRGFVGAVKAHHALHIASAASLSSIVELILEKALAHVDARDFSGRTPLSHAADCWHSAAAIDILLKTGADLDLEDWTGETPCCEHVKMVI